MALLTSALDTPFTPAAGPFNVQVEVANVALMRANASGATYVGIAHLQANAAYIVENPVAGAMYKMVGTGATVRADQ